MVYVIFPTPIYFVTFLVTMGNLHIWLDVTKLKSIFSNVLN